MAMTFGQRLKKYRNNESLTQQQLAEIIGVSTQAVSKWETDTGMPDISQIVPLARTLHVSSDCLLGITDEDDSTEFDAIYQKCMEIEAGNPCNWPPKAAEAEKGFRMMYEYFCLHPNNVRAAKYLLDMAELYFGKFSIFADQASMLKECDRFASCIFRYSDNADLQSEANFLIASVWMRAGCKDKAKQHLSKMPFRYGDGRYFSAQVTAIGGDYPEAQSLCRDSFTYRARFLIKTLRLTASLPDKTPTEKIKYDEYMLRIINALLSGHDNMPYTQIYQKMTLLSGLVKSNLVLDRKEPALACFEELLDTGEKYLAYLDGGMQGSGLILADDRIEIFGDGNTAPLYEMVFTCLNRAVAYAEKVKSDAAFDACIERAADICKKYS